MFSIFIASTVHSAWPSCTSSPTATATFTISPGIGQSRKREVSGGSLFRHQPRQFRLPRACAPAPSDRRRAAAAGTRRQLADLHHQRPRRRPRPGPAAGPAASRFRPAAPCHRRSAPSSPARSASIRTGILAALQADHPVLADLALVVVHPARDPGAADLGHPVHRRRRRRDPAQHRRRPASTPWNPSGYSSAMKAVVMSPCTKRGWSITADRNGRLWPIPSTSKASSATRIPSIAAARVGAQVQSLAIIGS